MLAIANALDSPNAKTWPVKKSKVQKQTKCKTIKKYILIRNGDPGYTKLGIGKLMNATSRLHGVKKKGKRKLVLVCGDHKKNRLTKN